MDISEFARLFPQKMEEIKSYIESNEIRDMFGIEAVNHFKQSFPDEGFTPVLSDMFFKCINFVQCVAGISWQAKRSIER